MPVAVCDAEVDDIEDLMKLGDILPNDRIANKRHVVPKVRKKKVQVTDKSGDRVEEIRTDSVIPGTQKIWVKTWGCSHNNSDGEYMAGQLASYGYQITDDCESAALWLLNSCTVKSPAEDHFRNEVMRGRKQGKHVVVAGCVPQGQPKADYIQGLSVIGVQQIDRVVEVVEESLKGHSVRLLGQKKSDGKKTGGAPLALPKIRKNPLIEIIAINTGCLNQCTYCKTKHARGELGSYRPEEIVDRAKQSFQEGCVEIWLTSEDLGAYGHDIGVTLPELLWQLVEVIPDGAMMRLGMTNPPYILEHLEEMAKILNHPRVYSFLHVPVQSGSDSVLMDMKREYCQADFRRVVDVLKERVPEVTIATDVICGFPTETEEDFDDTLQLVRDYKFPSLFINQFFPRPGTPAAKMQKVPTQEVKKRTKLISELFQSYRPYDHKVKRRERVLVTELSHDKQYYVAHNKTYDQVLVPKDDNLMGKMLEVDIISAGKHYLMSHIATQAEIRRPENVPPPLKKGQISGTPQAEPPSAQVAAPEYQGHPAWVQLGMIVVIIAVILKIMINVFSERTNIAI